VFERLYDELAADPAMAKMLEFGKLYSAQDAIVQKAVSTVRLMGAVASGEIKVSTDPRAHGSASSGGCRTCWPPSASTRAASI